MQSFLKSLLILALLPTLSFSQQVEQNPTASVVRTRTTNFNNNLSTADTTVQKALDTLDNLSAGGSGSPGGSDGQVQYNNGGSAFGGASSIFYDDILNNVGIGTTVPRVKLEVFNTMSVSNQGRLGVGTTVPTARLQVVATGNSSAALTLNANSSAFSVTNGGNVGVGNTNPQSKFTVGSSDQFAVSSTGNQSFNINGLATVQNISTNSSAALTFIGGGNANSRVIIQSTSGTGTTDQIRFAVGTNGGTSAMRINDNSGVVSIGIGTTTPRAAFEVYNTTLLGSASANGGQGRLGVGTTTPSARLDIKATGLSNASLTALISRGNTVGLSVTNAGYVGIGLSNPGTRFVVKQQSGEANALHGLSLMRSDNSEFFYVTYNGVLQASAGELTDYLTTSEINPDGDGLTIKATTTNFGTSGLTHYDLAHDIIYGSKFFAGTDLATTIPNKIGTDGSIAVGGYISYNETIPVGGIAAQSYLFSGITTGLFASPTAHLMVNTEGNGASGGESINGMHVFALTGPDEDGSGSGAGGNNKIYGGTGGPGAHEAASGRGGPNYIQAGLGGADTGGGVGANGYNFFNQSGGYTRFNTGSDETQNPTTTLDLFVIGHSDYLNDGSGVLGSITLWGSDNGAGRLILKASAGQSNLNFVFPSGSSGSPGSVFYDTDGSGTMGWKQVVDSEVDTLDTVSDRGASTDKVLTIAGALLATDQCVGLDCSSKGRIEFEDEATDNINLMNANVGIGTTNPRVVLEVINTISIVGISNGGQGRLGLGTTVPSARLHVIGTGSGAADLALLVGASTTNAKFVVGNNGNVGIGNSKPSNFFTIGATNNLQVNSSGVITQAGGTSMSIGSGNMTMSSGANVAFGNSSNNAAATATFTGGANAVSSAIIKSTSGTGTTDFIQLSGGANGATNILKATHSNNSLQSPLVGIGNTAPSVTLDVTGTVKASLSFISTAGSGGTIDGQMWNDSTQKSYASYSDGVKQLASTTLFSQTADKTIANTITETSGFGSGVGTLTLPANFFVAGKTIRIMARGVYTVSGLGANATVKIKYGSTVLASVATSALLTTGSNNAWAFEALITCRSTGATGTVVALGNINYKATSGRIFDDIDNAGAATTIDTTGSNAIDVSITWDSNTLRSITTTASVVEVLN